MADVARNDMLVLNWKAMAKRLRRWFKSENRGSKRIHSDLVAMAELRRAERDWARRQDGNRVGGVTQ